MKRWVLMAAVVAFLNSTMSGHAIPTLRLSADLGTTWVPITDQVFPDAGSNPGVVVWNGAVGTWSVNVTTGITKPQIGSTVAPQMDLNSVNVSSGQGGNLWIEFSEDNFGPTSGQMGANIGGTTAGSVSYWTYADQGNGLFIQTTMLTQQGPFTPIAFSGSASGPIGMVNPYSLTQVVHIQHRDAGTTSFNATLGSVPDGGVTAMLLGLGLAGVAALCRMMA